LHSSFTATSTQSLPNSPQYVGPTFSSCYKFKN
jgi:hypothetical protein